MGLVCRVLFVFAKTYAKLNRIGSVSEMVSSGIVVYDRRNNQIYQVSDESRVRAVRAKGYLSFHRKIEVFKPSLVLKRKAIKHGKFR